MIPHEVTVFMDVAVLSYFLVLQSIYTFLMILAVIEIARRSAERLPELDATVLLEESTPPVTILVPAYNESKHIVETVKGLLKLDYPRVQVLVINDGSKDDTLQTLFDAFDLEPAARPIQASIPTAEVRGYYRSKTDDSVWVLDKENKGKADALNAGINAARTPIVCSIDADTMVTRDALLRLVEAFIHDPQNVIAVGGTVRVANGCRIKDGIVEEVGAPTSWLARFQQVEYLRAFVFGRLGLNRLGGNLIISGAFGLFLREPLVAVGGYDTNTVGEDMELVIKLHRYAEDHGGRVVQLSEPIAYTEVPESFSGLATQRARWHRGLGQSLWKHRSMMGRKRYGLPGLIVMPFFVLFELLGPVFELVGYFWFFLAIMLGFADPRFTVAFFVVAVLWGMIHTVSCVIADRWTFRHDEKESGGGKLLLVAFLENLGYRQLTTLFRLRGLAEWIGGKKSWGEMERIGYGQPQVASQAASSAKEESK